MTDLISREEVMSLVGGHPALLERVGQLRTITPQVVFDITAGVLRRTSADYPINVYSLDFKVRAEAASELIMINGSEARFTQEEVVVNPDLVTQVIQMPTLDVAVQCGDCEWLGEIGSVEPIKNLEQFVDPGNIVPAGKCPKCDALAYLLK